MSSHAILAFTTCPDDAIAKEIAAILVREKFAACVNRVAGVRSTYVWQGQLQDDAEILLIIKSVEDRLAGLERRLKELHPYELPEFVVTRIDGGNERYLDWIRTNVRPEGDRE